MENTFVKEIKSAIESGEKEKARELLRESLKNPDGEIYHLAAQVALNERQREVFLSKARDFEELSKCNTIIEKHNVRDEQKSVGENIVEENTSIHNKGECLTR